MSFRRTLCAGRLVGSASDNPGLLFVGVDPFTHLIWGRIYTAADTVRHAELPAIRLRDFVQWIPCSPHTLVWVTQNLVQYVALHDHDGSPVTHQETSLTLPEVTTDTLVVVTRKGTLDFQPTALTGTAELTLPTEGYMETVQTNPNGGSFSLIEVAGYVQTQFALYWVFDQQTLAAYQDPTHTLLITAFARSATVNLKLTGDGVLNVRVSGSPVIVTYPTVFTRDTTFPDGTRRIVTVGPGGIPHTLVVDQDDVHTTTNLLTNEKTIRYANGSVKVESPSRTVITHPDGTSEELVEDPDTGEITTTTVLTNAEGGFTTKVQRPDGTS